MLSQGHTEGERSSLHAAPADDLAYSPQEIAERCGLSRRRVYDWLSWGWLRGRRQGGRWMVMANDWEFFVRTCRGARGRLMPSLRDWGPLWQSYPAGEAAPAGSD